MLNIVKSVIRTGKDQKYFVEKYILKIYICFKTNYNQIFAFLYYNRVFNDNNITLKIIRKQFGLVYLLFLIMECYVGIYMKNEVLIVIDYINFLKNITSNYKNKLIILDNASSHRNAQIKELIN